MVNIGKWLRRPDSNRRYAAYETAALPLGYSAVIGKLARRPGAAPGWRGFGDLAAQAGARRVVNSGKRVRPAGIAPAFPQWPLHLVNRGDF